MGEPTPSSSGLSKQTGYRHSAGPGCILRWGQREAHSFETKWILKDIVVYLDRLGTMGVPSVSAAQVMPHHSKEPIACLASTSHDGKCCTICSLKPFIH